MNPYLIEGPAVISFSGGRTSGYMLRKILNAGIDKDTIICFANTGKERVETLDFVHDCEYNWGCKIHWLEYRRNFLPKYKSHDRELAALRARQRSGAAYFPNINLVNESGFTEVTYEIASRNGEPFNNLIEMMGLPNIGTRLCTQEMKIRVIKKYMQSLGYDHWINVIGIRYDEPKRISRLRDQYNTHWDNQLPLADAKITESDVLNFWHGQPFDLKLNTWEGNCDLCFLKATWKRQKIAQERPDLLNWWKEQEDRTGMTFRSKSQRYEYLTQCTYKNAANASDDLGDCLCTD